MHDLVRKNEHNVWRERWYTIMLGVSLQVNFYMTWKDQVFVVNVVVISLTQKTMASNVISQLANATIKLSIIVKIRQYRGLHEGHHFIPMAMEVHDIFEHDIDHFIKECAHLFHNRRFEGHLSLSFCIQLFKWCVSIVFQSALTSTIKRKIALATNVYFRPPITIRSHDLHLHNFREAMGEITSYHERD
jgi:hypothetical protein